MRNLFLSVFGISVSMSLMVAVLILLTSFFNKRYAAKWKYLIWIFLALRLLIPFGGADGHSAVDVQIKNQAAPESEENRADIPADTAALPRRVVVEIPAQMTTPIAMQPERSSITLLDAAAFIWMIVCLIFLSVHFISYLHYKRQVQKEGTVIKDARVLCQMFRLKRELHIRSAVQMIEYAKASSPMLIGFFKPVLVLPKEHCSAGELYFILKHELVHLKRGDMYLKLLFVAANAVHWFNPFIWIMQKEAVVDMELSCDERVMQGADYAVRKAYTETLLSMLHKQCAKRTVLSTQFYEGKKVMKKRFKNILMEKAKKNGISILIGAVILTISLGTLVGCQTAKDAGGKSGKAGEGLAPDKNNPAGSQAFTPDENHSRDSQAFTPDENHSGDNQASAPDKNNAADNQAMAPDGNGSSENNTLENARVLTFLKEGETEQKQAALVTGDGYALHLPENEWRKSDSDAWMAAANERVMLRVTYFKDTTVKEKEKELADNGYGKENYEIMKQEGDMIYKARLHEFDNGVWSVCYCYPADAEEGWGRELPVIADTFAVLSLTL